MSAELLALHRRCEAATEADRELDVAIALALDLVPDTHERAQADGVWQNYFWHKTDHKAGYFIPERYTGSIDAALTLVRGPNEYPEIKTYLLDCATQTSVYCHPVAYVWTDSGKVMGKGRSAPLALASAALRALAEAAR